MSAADAPIRELLDRRAAAHAAKDATALLALYVPTPVIFGLAPPLLAQEDRAELEAWFATWQGPIRISYRDLAIQLAGELALCHGLQLMAGRKIDDGDTRLWARATFGCVRMGSDWRIAHEHVSVPFLMDGSFRAAVHLEP